MSVNLFINYFLLLTVAKFLGILYKKYRLLFGALLGAGFSLIILFPSIPFWLNVLLKIPMSGAIVALAYRNPTWRVFCKQLLCFYAVSFSFAGMMLAISYCFQPSGLLIKNSAVYIAVSPLLLLAVTVVCYFALLFIYRITGKNHLQHTFCKMEIWRQGKSAKIIAKVDTGNSLTEPFSGLPVAVVERSAIASILPAVDLMLVGKGENQAIGEKIRMIPFGSIGGQGVLPAFQPDRCVIHHGKQVIETTAFYLAISNQKISSGAYQGLIHPDILSSGVDGKPPQKTEEPVDREADL